MRLLLAALALVSSSVLAGSSDFFLEERDGLTAAFYKNEVLVENDFVEFIGHTVINNTEVVVVQHSCGGSGCSWIDYDIFRIKDGKVTEPVYLSPRITSKEIEKRLSLRRTESCIFLERNPQDGWIYVNGLVVRYEDFKIFTVEKLCFKGETK